MKWFYDVKIATKLLVSFTVVLTLTAFLGIFSILQLAKVKETSTDLATNWMPAIVAAGEIKYGAARMRSAALMHLLSDDLAAKERYEKMMGEMLGTLKKQQQRYESLIANQEERKLYTEFTKLQDEYMILQNRIIALSQAQKNDEALALFRGDSLRLYGSVEEKIREIFALNEDGASAADKLGDTLYTRSRLWIIGALVGCIVFGLAIALWLSRMIASSLREAVTVAQTVAAGDLTSRIEVRSKDETGQLLLALKGMNESLAEIVGEVRGGTDAMASASAQIASGNLDLSARTEEQASSLEETASSMEELTSTVKQNADNARQANALAISASEIAVKGGTVVGQVVDTMASINSSSKKIVDIISVIDGIAFQTNILALNAAVEAARAGEQGRGFAVVATEVRTLAQRSAAAAKEIKELIDDSVGKVESGAKLVDQAGVTMQEIVDSVKRVTDIMGEISSASHEQTAGIEQINQAITQMDQVTQQNASLVEESAAASEALQGQANRLAQAVSIFKVEARQARIATAPIKAANKRSQDGMGSKPIINSANRAIAIATRQPKRSASAEVDGEDWEQF